MDSMHISFGSMASQSKLALIKSLSDVVESVMPLIQCALTSLAKMVQIAGWCATTGSSFLTQFFLYNARVHKKLNLLNVTV